MAETQKEYRHTLPDVETFSAFITLGEKQRGQVLRFTKALVARDETASGLLGQFEREEISSRQMFDLFDQERPAVPIEG